MKSLKHISEVIDTYSEEIQSRNYENFKKFAFGGMVLTGIIALFGLIFSWRLKFNVEYCLLFVYFILCYVFTKFILSKHKKYTLLAFYIALFPIFVVGILMGTFFDSEKSAITVFIFLCTMTMFITDKPIRIIGYLLFVSVGFLLCSFLSKSTNLFIVDCINWAIYFSIGVCVNMLMLTDRVESAENYVLSQTRANEDALTGILNRGAGENAVIERLKNGQKGSFFMLDIDCFKCFNDSYGHQVGDKVICSVSSQLKNAFREGDVVWRLGGDEFAVFALDMVDFEECTSYIKKVQEGLRQVKVDKGISLEVKVSMGCAVCDKSDCSFDAIYKVSDNALYEAKSNGKNTFVIKKIVN